MGWSGFKFSCNCLGGWGWALTSLEPLKEASGVTPLFWPL